MKAPCEFDHTLLGELIARRWQEYPGYYSLDSQVGRGWLDAFWTPRSDHRGVELHWIRRAGPDSAAELSTA